MRVVMKLKCPLHDDTDPSLALYDNKRLVCYGCGYRGSVVEFLTLFVPILTALEISNSGYCVEFLQTLLGGRKNGGGRFDPGKKIPFDPSHLALQGVKVREETLEKHSSYLAERALVLRFPFRSPPYYCEEERVLEQYRLSPGKYLFSGGAPIASGLAVFSGEAPATCIVEGILDALRLRELGYSGTLVALLGSVITIPRIEVLRCLPPPYFVASDMDAAGDRIARALEKNIGGLRVTYDGGDPQCLSSLPEILAV